MYHANSQLNSKAKGTHLIKDKIDFKTNIVTSNKEGYFIMVKGLIHQENMTVTCIKLMTELQER